MQWKKSVGFKPLKVVIPKGLGESWRRQKGILEADDCVNDFDDYTCK